MNYVEACSIPLIFLLHLNSREVQDLQGIFRGNTSSSENRTLREVVKTLFLADMLLYLSIYFALSPLLI